MKTTGDPAKHRLAADRGAITNDGQDIAYVTVSDPGHRTACTVPTALNALHYTIAGPGEIVAVDNGDETSLAPTAGHQRQQRLQWPGARHCPRVRRKTGPITLIATADGLTSGSVTLSAKPPNQDAVPGE